eukprot:3923519-Rhodomonas_salina.1
MCIRDRVKGAGMPPGTRGAVSLPSFTSSCTQIMKSMLIHRTSQITDEARICLRCDTSPTA